MVLVQDYHFALLPATASKQRARTRGVAIFWHIPWPNPEAFGICPWQHELLDGLLGADLVGFHTQAHCNNFLDTVDRALESRIDRERFAVERNGHSARSCDPSPSVWPSRDGHRSVRAGGVCRTERARCCARDGVERPFWVLASTAWTIPRASRSDFAAWSSFFEKYPAYRGAVHLRADRRAQPDRTSAATTI